MKIARWFRTSCCLTSERSRSLHTRRRQQQNHQPISSRPQISDMPGCLGNNQQQGEWWLSLWQLHHSSLSLTSFCFKHPFSPPLIFSHPLFSSAFNLSGLRCCFFFPQTVSISLFHKPCFFVSLLTVVVWHCVSFHNLLISFLDTKPWAAGYICSQKRWEKLT